MAIVVKSYIGDNGEILFPVSSTDDNTSNLISENGTYYMAVLQDDTAPTIQAGNPMGLLLVLTYPATP